MAHGPEPEPAGPESEPETLSWADVYRTNLCGGCGHAGCPACAARFLRFLAEHGTPPQGGTR